MKSSMTHSSNKLALFDIGFRPFFLLAGIFAIASMAIWLMILQGQSVENYYPGNLIHSHEVVFGFSVAVISGFLLTAVRSWTQQTSLSGAHLAGLALLWLAGRIAPWTNLPNLITAIIDILFLPCLMIAVLIPLLKGKKSQHLMFILVLGAMSFANILIHGDILGYTEDTALTGLYLGVHILILLITLLGGRVIPSFTQSGLKRLFIEHQAISRPVIEKLCLYSLVAWIIVRTQLDDGNIIIGLSLIVFIAQLLRLTGWFHRGVFKEPLIWVLHSGYAWMTFGFLLMAFAAAGQLQQSLALHAFTAGGIGLMTLGMMSRVALGHTGREMKINPWINVAYIILNIGILLRVCGPMLMPTEYNLWLTLSGGCWMAAFGIFSIVYAPILWSPRVDL